MELEIPIVDVQLTNQLKHIASTIHLVSISEHQLCL